MLAKSASGALEYVPIVTVQNLARGLAALKERGFLLVGLDSSGESDLAELPLRAPLALVLGAEGKGLRQLTRTTCDHVARLNLPGAITRPQCVECCGARALCRDHEARGGAVIVPAELGLLILAAASPGGRCDAGDRRGAGDSKVAGRPTGRSPGKS